MLADIPEPRRSLREEERAGVGGSPGAPHGALYSASRMFLF